jgi:Raffinose synthase or seed imbibition protein Sip1
MESGDDAVLGQRWPHALLLACGDDPFALIEAAVPEAAKYSGTAKPLREKRLPPSIDKFAWCSWDAFYSSVSAQGLTEGVRSLSAGGAPPKMVIIDDGWQSTDLDAQFKGWQDPRSAFIATARERLGSLAGSVDGNEEAFERAVKELARELYIEGESEMISAVLRDVPAGSATGQLLQELKAADDESFEAIDYQRMAQQHDAGGFGSEAAEALALRRRDGTQHRRGGNVITRASLAVIQYVAGLIMGAFQAVFIIFYQWVVDPAADDTWPVKFFTYLVTGPLRNPMLQFYADQTNFTRRLVDIRANSKFHGPDATPESVHSGKKEDLASVVAHLRSEMHVEFIYCWHGLSAYWSGVCPDSPAMRKYRPRVVYAKPPRSLREIEPSMLWNPSVLGGLGAVYDPTPLFRDMHSYLAAAGVNGVKVDCQAGVGMVGSVTGGGPAVAARYHAALEDSVAEHFPSNDAINCMCHSTENIYRWRDTAVARASDDFFPTDTASHMPHVAACAFNGLFLSALALPDFDMFQSKHVVAPLHAAARAVSGGPVYVSDAPGHHNFEILHQLVLPDGGVLRAKLPGRPTRDCLFLDVLRDEKSLLKIWNVNNTTGVVGVFNLQGSSWDRSRRRFNFHNTSPPKLTTRVNVADVEMFRDNNNDDKNNSSSAGNGAVIDSHRSEKEQKKQEMETRASTPSDVSEGAHWQTSNGNGTANGNGAAVHGGNNGSGDGYESDVSSGPDSVHNGTASSSHHKFRSSQPAASGDVAAWVNITGELHRLPFDGGVDVELDGAQAAIVTFARITSDYGVEFAPLGLKNMMNSGGAITCSTVEADRGTLGAAAASASVIRDTGSATESFTDLVNGKMMSVDYADEDDDSSAVPPVVPRFHIGVRGRGTFIALCTKEPEACTVDGYGVRFSWDKEESRLEVEVPQVGKHTEQKLVVQFRK